MCNRSFLSNQIHKLSILLIEAATKYGCWYWYFPANNRQKHLDSAAFISCFTQTLHIHVIVSTRYDIHKGMVLKTQNGGK